MCQIRVFIFLLLSAFPALVNAETYVPLLDYGGWIDPSNLSTEDWFGLLYVIAIGVAAFLAVVKLIFAGLQYVLTDVVTSKESAKHDIRGAIVGLLIVLSAVLILQTINPQLTNFDALDNLQPVAVQKVVVSEPPSQTDPIEQYCNNLKLTEGVDCTIDPACKAIEAGKLCKEQCEAKNGVFVERLYGISECAHNMPEGIPLGQRRPDLAQSISGRIVEVPEGGGREWLRTKVEETGKTTISGFARAYWPGTHLARRDSAIEDCRDKGGSSYDIFYRAGGSEVLVCYE